MKQHAKGYRYGRGGMQIHFALSAPPPWCNPELRHVPLVHFTESMEQVCLSVTQANNGYLPDRPTFGIGQPTALDPSRAPDGGWILWIQMQELPRHLKGDAAGEITVPEDGCWNETVREAVADRIQQRLEMVMPGVTNLIIGRKAISPADLENYNCNLVGEILIQELVLQINSFGYDRLPLQEKLRHIKRQSKICSTLGHQHIRVLVLAGALGI